MTDEESLKLFRSKLGELVVREIPDFTITVGEALWLHHLAKKAIKFEPALLRIEKWFGEFPETGTTWDDGTPQSYATLYGSNGERDFMRGIAREALNK